MNCTRSDDRCRRSVTAKSKGSPLRARSRLHSPSGRREGDGGRATSKEFVVVDGYHTAQVVAIYLARRASTRLPYLPVSTSAPRPCPLLLFAHPFPRSSLAITHGCVSVRDATTSDYRLTTVCVETRDLKETGCYDNELLLLECNLHYFTQSHVRVSVIRIRFLHLICN